MTCVEFASQDRSLLCSGVDNFVQLLALPYSSKPLVHYDIPPIDSPDSYTRASFLGTSDNVCVSTSEEHVLRVLSPSGKILTELSIYNYLDQHLPRKWQFIYVQEMKTNPLNPFNILCITASYVGRHFENML